MFFLLFIFHDIKKPLRNPLGKVFFAIDEICLRRIMSEFFDVIIMSIAWSGFEVKKLLSFVLKMFFGVELKVYSDGRS